jgi:hypothetical protein
MASIGFRSLSDLEIDNIMVSMKSKKRPTKWQVVLKKFIGDACEALINNLMRASIEAERLELEDELPTQARVRHLVALLEDPTASFDVDDLTKSYNTLPWNMRLNDEAFFQVLNFCITESLEDRSCDLKIDTMTVYNIIKSNSPSHDKNDDGERDEDIFLDKFSDEAILFIRLYIEMLIERILKNEEHLYPNNQLITKESIKDAINAWEGKGEY